MTILKQFEKRENLTHIEQCIADCLMENQDMVAKLDLAASAKASHTSDAAIVRLCRKLGFKGYKMELIDYIYYLQYKEDDDIVVKTKENKNIGDNVNDADYGASF